MFARDSRVYVDECKARGYYIAAAAVLPQDVREVDKAMRSLARPGQRRIHFTKESDSSKRRILAEIARLGVAVIVYQVKGAPDRIARPRCLDALVDDLSTHACSQLIIERDESLESSDRRLIAAALQRNGGYDLRYEHASPTEHAALWISDAVAWSWHKGGDWRRRVERIVVLARRLG